MGWRYTKTTFLPPHHRIACTITRVWSVSCCITETVRALHLTRMSCAFDSTRHSMERCEQSRRYLGRRCSRKKLRRRWRFVIKTSPTPCSTCRTMTCYLIFHFTPSVWGHWLPEVINRVVCFHFRQTRRKDRCYPHHDVVRMAVPYETHYTNWPLSMMSFTRCLHHKRWIALQTLKMVIIIRIMIIIMMVNWMWIVSHRVLCNCTLRLLNWGIYV